MRYVTISSQVLSQRPLVFPQPPTHLFKIARYPIPAPLSTRHSEMALDPAVYSTVPYVRSTTDCTVQYCRVPVTVPARCFSTMAGTPVQSSGAPATHAASIPFSSTSASERGDVRSARQRDLRLNLVVGSCLQLPFFPLLLGRSAQGFKFTCGCSA